MTEEELKAAAALVGGYVFQSRVIKLVVVGEPTCKGCCLQNSYPFCLQKIRYATPSISCINGHFVDVEIPE